MKHGIDAEDVLNLIERRPEKLNHMNIFISDNSEETVLRELGPGDALRALIALALLVAFLVSLSWWIAPLETEFVVFGFFWVVSGLVTCGVAAAPLWWMFNHRIGPLRMLSRCLDYARAVGFALRDGARVAWYRAVERWPDYLLKARELR